jgi:hypothetical protein
MKEKGDSLSFYFTSDVRNSYRVKFQDGYERNRINPKIDSSNNFVSWLPEQTVYWKVLNDSIIKIFDESFVINLNEEFIQIKKCMSCKFFLMNRTCRSTRTEPIEIKGENLSISHIVDNLNGNKLKTYIVLTFSIVSNCNYDAPISIFIDKKTKLPVKIIYARLAYGRINISELSISNRKIKRKTKHRMSNFE